MQCIITEVNAIMSTAAKCIDERWRILLSCRCFHRRYSKEVWFHEKMVSLFLRLSLFLMVSFVLSTSENVPTLALKCPIPQGGSGRWGHGEYAIGKKKGFAPFGSLLKASCGRCDRDKVTCGYMGQNHLWTAGDFRRL